MGSTQWNDVSTNSKLRHARQPHSGRSQMPHAGPRGQNAIGGRCDHQSKPEWYMPNVKCYMPNAKEYTPKKSTGGDVDISLQSAWDPHWGK